MFSSSVGIRAVTMVQTNNVEIVSNDNLCERSSYLVAYIVDNQERVSELDTPSAALSSNN